MYFTEFWLGFEDTDNVAAAGECDGGAELYVRSVLDAILYTLYLTDSSKATAYDQEVKLYFWSVHFSKRLYM
jgi:hypothetical protein